MSDSKKDTTQMDGLDSGTSGFDKSGESDNKGKSKPRSGKAKPVAKNESKGKPSSATADGFTTVRRVWPD